jgi:hypothetical protein
MVAIDYDRTTVDCPACGLQRVTLRAVERMVQHAWGTKRAIRFVLYRDSSGGLTVTDSLPD